MIERNCCGPQSAGARCPWSPEEREVVQKNLAHCLLLKKLPGKDDILPWLSKEPCLQHRTWRNIKDFVRNKLSSLRWTSSSDYLPTLVCVFTAWQYLRTNDISVLHEWCSNCQCLLGLIKRYSVVIWAVRLYSGNICCLLCMFIFAVYRVEVDRCGFSFHFNYLFLISFHIGAQ